MFCWTLDNADTPGIGLKENEAYIPVAHDVKTVKNEAYGQVHDGIETQKNEVYGVQCHAWYICVCIMITEIF